MKISSPVTFAFKFWYMAAELLICLIIGAIGGFYLDNARLWMKPPEIWCLIGGLGYFLGALICMIGTSWSFTFSRFKLAIRLIAMGIIVMFIRIHCFNHVYKFEEVPEADSIAQNCNEAKWYIAIKFQKDNGETGQETLYVKGNTAHINDMVNNTEKAWNKNYGNKNKFISVEKGLCFIPVDYAKQYAKDNDLTYHCAKTWSEKASELGWEDGINGKNGINDVP